jgi:hypothetical protein
MTLTSKDIKRNVDGPSGKVARVAHTNYPDVSTGATLDSLLAFAGEVMATNKDYGTDPFAVLAELIQTGIDSKVQSKTYAKLGEVDAVSKMIAQTVKAMTPVLAAQGFSSDDVRNMVLALPQIKTAVESAKDSPNEITVQYSVADLFSDGRKSNEPEADEAAA